MTVGHTGQSGHTSRRGGPGVRLTIALVVLALAAAAIATALSPRPTSGSGRPAHRPAGIRQQEDAASALLIPFTLRGAGLAALAAARTPTPVPTDTPTATPTDTPTLTPSPSPTPGPSPTPLPPACTRALAERLEQRRIRMDAAIAHGDDGYWTRIPIVMAVRTDGSSIVAWSSGADVHVTPLSPSAQRTGDDLVLPGESVHGLVAHDDGGGAALIARPDDMVFVRFDADGALLFERTLVGLRPHGEVGAKWIDSWGYEGRLVWTGGTYAAYFGHTQFFGANGKHQGDLMWLFDDAGERIPREQAGNYPTWDWGCSHSLDVRLAHNRGSDLVVGMCLSDSYPGKGFFVNDSTRIGSPVWADGNGRANGRLGGLVPVGAGFAVTYGTESERRSYDVALTLISEYGYPLADYWLTDTPSVDESGPHLATYGEDLLAQWTDRDGFEVAIVDQDGNIVDGPVVLQADVQDRDDFVNWPNGDVGWPAVDSDGRTLVVSRIPYCR